MLSSDNGCAMQLIKDTISSLNSISNVYPEASQLAERLESCRIEIKDVADEIETGQDSLEYDPERQAYVNERLNTIYSLLKKHNVQSVEELLDISERINDKLSAIDNDEELIGELQKRKTSFTCRSTNMPTSCLIKEEKRPKRLKPRCARF